MVLGVGLVDWKVLVCLLVSVLGIVLYVVGANIYDNLVGWAGVYLFVGGLLAYVFVKILFRGNKDSVDQKS